MVSPDLQFPAYVSPKSYAQLTPSAGSLRSLQGEVFQVVDGIPRFVELTNYAHAFGVQWKRFASTQLDSRTGHSHSRDRLIRCIGVELWQQLDKLKVLEAGCGAGRFTEILLEQGALVQSIDLSAAVEVNHANFRHNQRHRVAQASITQLPFESHQFDLVLCLGVIQHTPSPECTLQALASQVKPGGWLIVDHYTGNWRTLIGYWCSPRSWLRLVLKRLPPQLAMKCVEWLLRLFYPLNRWASSSKSAVLKKLVAVFSPLLCYHEKFPDLDDKQQRELAFLDTYDALTDYYKHWRSPAQIRGELVKLGLSVEYCALAGNGVEARARAPLVK